MLASLRGDHCRQYMCCHRSPVTGLQKPSCQLYALITQSWSLLYVPKKENIEKRGTSVEHDKVLEQVVLSTVVASLPKCLRPLSPSCFCCHFFPGLSGTNPSDAVSYYSPSFLLSASLVCRHPSKEI